MSYAPEVQTDFTGKWYGNGVRFETQAEAEAWVFDRSMRWSSVRDTRVVKSDDEANYRLVNDSMVAISAVQR